jgi:hypothetical protein
VLSLIHTLQFTITRTMSSVCCIISCCRLETASNVLASSKSKSKSKSHCDWRSVNQQVLVSSPIWGSWPGIYYCLTLTVLFCGTPSLTIGRFCLLYMMLVLASVVSLGSESLGTRDHILLSQIWDFPFFRLLRLAGSRWRYSNPPPHGCSFLSFRVHVINGWQLTHN